MPLWPKGYDEQLCTIAMEAGEAILRYWNGGQWSVTVKADESPVTQADLASQAVIVEGLKAIQPSAQIVGEESDPNQLTIDESKGFWLVDPLDGTKEFIAGSEEFAVCMAWVVNGQAVWGLLHAPAKGQTIVGAAGLDGQWGAWMKEKGKEKGSEKANDQKQWQSIAVQPSTDRTIFLGSVRASSEQEQQLIAALQECRAGVQTQAMGSALKFMELAQGNAHGYCRYGPTCLWDLAAGAAIVQGAGGWVSDWNGQPIRFSSNHSARNPSFVCVGDEQLRDEVLEVTRGIGGRV